MQNYQIGKEIGHFLPLHPVTLLVQSVKDKRQQAKITNSPVPVYERVFTKQNTNIRAMFHIARPSIWLRPDHVISALHFLRHQRQDIFEN